MIAFSDDQYVKEWEQKKKRDDDYFAQKSVLQLFRRPTIAQEKESDPHKSYFGNDEAVIDARDSEYIWCKAEVMAVIEAKNEENSILVHYIGWGRKYDEVLSINSPRIAIKGFYTERDDIPHYQPNENKSKKPVLNLPATNEKVEIIEELKKD